MAKLSFFLICVLIPSLTAKCTVKKAEPLFRRSVYEFSVDLLTRIAQEKENHFVTSTLSTWILLTSTSFGATDTTLAELKEILKLNNDTCLNKKYLKIAASIASNNNTDVVLERTSNIYVDHKLEILKKFKKKISKIELSNFENISFEDLNLVAQIINDYVSNATHKTIDKIVSPGDLKDVLMIIIDAIYFKGSWQTPFHNESTKVSPFYNEQGDKIGEVNLMFLSSSFNMMAVEDIQSHVLELPYGKDERYSMFIFLPYVGVPLNQMLKNLTLIDLTSLNKMFEEFDKEVVSVQIPRFKITSDISKLKELLIDMGLKAMFDSSEARFPLISHYPLHVSNIIQKAYIEVTEKGTVASAATVAEFSFRSFDGFTANRPFLFMIVDKKNEVPIFTGAYSKPTLF